MDFGGYKLKRYLLGVLLFGSCGFTVVPAAAESTSSARSFTRVAYAGFALRGDAQELATRYPFSLGLEKRLNQNLFERVRGIEPDHYQLDTEQFTDADKGHTLSMAFVLDQEKVSVEQVGDVYKALIQVSGQMLVFDFDQQERAVIASYPVRNNPFVDTFTTPPKKSDLQQLVDKYYFGGLEGMPSLLDTFVDLVQIAPIKQRYALEIGIGDVLLSPTALAVWPSALRQDQPALRSAVGRNLASQLAAFQQVSIIPRALDAAVSSMALRFTGQRSATFLSLPEPAFLIDLAVVDLTRSVYSQNEVGSSLLYGAFAQIRVRENGALGKVILDQDLRHGVAKPVPATQSDVDHWAASDDSLSGLFTTFAQEASRPSRSWIKDQTLTRADLKQFKAFNKVIQSCR